MVTALPAAYLGAALVKDEVFRNAATTCLPRICFSECYASLSQGRSSERSIDIFADWRAAEFGSGTASESRLAINRMPEAKIAYSTRPVKGGSSIFGAQGLRTVICIRKVRERRQKDHEIISGCVRIWRTTGKVWRRPMIWRRSCGLSCPR